METNQFGCSGQKQSLDIELQGCNLVADFIADKTSICSGDSVTFTNMSEGTRAATQYQWDFGAGAVPQTTSGEGPHKVTFDHSGSYTVRLIVTDGLSDTLTMTDYILVNIIPAATIMKEDRCGEGLVLFTVEDNPQFNRVDFSRDTNSSDIDKDLTVPYSHNELVQENDSVRIFVRVENLTTGCISKWIASDWSKAYPIPDSKEIINYENPDRSSQDYLDILCNADSGIYTVNIDQGSSVTWDIESLNLNNITTDILRVRWNTGPGDYSVTAVETSRYGCPGPLAEAMVHISEPVVSIGNDIDICQGETHTFTTSKSFTSYEWQDGSDLSSFTTGIQGIVKVTVTDEFGCLASDSAVLTVHEVPVLNLGKDTILCGTGAYRLEVPGFSDYHWSTGETGNFIFVYPGQQTISLTVENTYGCSDTDTLKVLECIPVNLLGEITNAFTPNNDNNHDEWVINNIDLFPDVSIKVFDRWGRLVFSVNGGYKNDWKGTYNGKDLPVDTYYYVIDLHVAGSEPITGTLTIIR